jgi:hypothetical protein
VDIATNWWEGEAIAARTQQATKKGLIQMKERLPFRIMELHPDNDSALVNDLLWTTTERVLSERTAIRVDHFPNQGIKARIWAPAESCSGFSIVAKQNVDLSGTKELRIRDHILSIIQADMGKS